MNEELYPQLSKEGQEHAELLINLFKKKLKKIAEETLSELYVNIGQYIESDSWTNYKNSLLNGLKNYPNTDRKYDFKKVREVILKEHREEIINDLNQDLMNRITELEIELNNAYKRRY